MQFVVSTRAHNIGGGWRRFRTVVADSASEACEIAYGEPMPRQQWLEGTRDKPFVVNGGASDIMAEPDEGP